MQHSFWEASLLWCSYRSGLNFVHLRSVCCCWNTGVDGFVDEFVVRESRPNDKQSEFDTAAVPRLGLSMIRRT